MSSHLRALRRALPLLAVLPLPSILPLPALAHVTLETTQAPPGSTYKAVLRVGHGCEGSPTRTLRVTIPEGVIEAKPMPKSGWTETTTKGSYAKTYDYFGRPVAEGVKEIAWTGGDLADDRFDEFVFRAYLAKDAAPPGGTLWFPVVQECVKGANNWVQIPAAGQDAHALKEPAPGVRLVAAAPATDSPAAHAHGAHGGVAAAQAAPMPGMDGHAGHAMPATSPAGGAEVRAGDLVISPPWTRATAAGAKVAAGYLTVTNTGSQSDKLVDASFPKAGKVEVHEMSMRDGVMLMRPVTGGIPIPAGGTVELKPGGYHIMFMDLRAPVAEGEIVRGTLTFERAGKVEVSYKAGGLAARGPGGHSHGTK